MKITLDIPDETMCAFFSFIYRGRLGGLKMQVKQIGTADMLDGAEIKAEEIEEAQE